MGASGLDASFGHGVVDVEVDLAMCSANLAEWVYLGF